MTAHKRRHTTQPFALCKLSYTLFFGDWGTGRDKYRKIRKAEIEHMKAKDME